MKSVNDELIDNLVNAGKEDQSNMKDQFYSNLITDYKDNGYSVRKLTRKYGLTRYRITKFLKDHNIHKYTKDRVKKMVKAYHKYHSMAKVGRLFGVTKTDIWYIFKDHGIKRDKSTNEKGREMRKHGNNSSHNCSNAFTKRNLTSEYQTTSKPMNPFKHLQYIHKVLKGYQTEVSMLRSSSYKVKYEKAEAKIKKLERAINQL